MAAYLMARVKVRDPEGYRGYTDRTPAVIAKYGGRFLVRGGATETLEGEACTERVVIVEFPSMQAARAFWDSPEYQEAKSFRLPAAEGEFILVQGV